MKDNSIFVPKRFSMANPTISVIVPVYDVEVYIRQCLDSIINQTYDNLEIILVNDGSPDRCGEICNEYANKDSRIIVIHQENGGLSAARNAGLDIAHGEYIMFVDSDDWVESIYCEKALEMIFKHHVEMVIIGYTNIYKNRSIDAKAKHSRMINSEEAIRHIVLNDEPSICNAVWNKIYHKRLFQNLRFPLGMIAEDAAIQYKLLHLSGKIYVLNQSFYNYRRRLYSLAGHYAIHNKITQCHIFQVYHERLSYIKEQLNDRQLLEQQSLIQVKRVMMNIDRLNKNIPEERYFYGLMTTFIKENKDYLLSLPCDKYTRIFLHSKKLYHIYRQLGNLKGILYSWFNPYKGKKMDTSAEVDLEYYE